jgi:hypothetical protein
MTLYMILLGACAIAASVCSRTGRVCGLVLTANFIAGETYVRMTGQFTPWVWNLAIDTLALLFLTAPPVVKILRFHFHPPQSGQIGAVLAATYATQCIMHLGFGVSKHGEPYTYWQSLTAMAWLQLLILFGGSMSHGCGRFAGHYLRRRVPLDSAAHPAGLSARKGAE